MGGDAHFKSKRMLLILSISIIIISSSSQATTDDDDVGYGLKKRADNPWMNNQVNKTALLEGLPDVSENIVDEELRALVNATYGMGKLKTNIASIEPEGGPTGGNTRVLVRGGPFANLELIYPHPVCRFGSKATEVEATYVDCTLAPTNIEGFEPRHKDKNQTCLVCEESPLVEKDEIVAFSISLTGDFSDTQNNVPYRYYKPTTIHALKPRYGPKDGDTWVEVWGENFLNFDENIRCNFGQKSVKAHFINKNYMSCQAPFSEVVGKAVPFSISLNKQQNSKTKIDYYYYNFPAVTEVVPNYGPDSGGVRILLKGLNFRPFSDLGDEVNNDNDTFCLFEGIGKVKAIIISSTKAYCEAPTSQTLQATKIELTLNNQQYTDDELPFFYYHPPEVFDCEPREGPTKGGTQVMVLGNKFKLGKNITCKFGTKVVKGIYLDSTRIKCVSPQVIKPGQVTLSISYEGEKYSGESLKYLYYETPIVHSVEPACGPVTGYTQLLLKGENFIKTGFGFGKAKCIFNNTVRMNATIIDETTLYCDSPPLAASSQSDSAVPFYIVQVTLNGREVSQDVNITKFTYYNDPIIKGISPNIGPMSGGTITNVLGKGFSQAGACNVTARYGSITQNVSDENRNNTVIKLNSPKVRVPGAVVVSVSLNGQQFVKDKTLHYRDIENTFTYYQGMYFESLTPKSGPTNGGTLVKIGGLGFATLKQSDPSGKAHIYARFIDHLTYELIGWEFEAFDVSDEEFSIHAPPAPLDTKAIIQVSLNKKNWDNVILPANNTFSYKYFNAPQVTSLSPSYGPVKNPNDEYVTIGGNNFACLDEACTDAKVRFGDPKKGAIYVKAEPDPDDSTKIKAKIPKYTKPDVLPVEVSFNGLDYTHDNKTYGFFDPFVIDVQPRLLSIKGTTKLNITGFGFVNSTGADALKAKFNSLDGDLQCNLVECTKDATFIDKHTIQTTTYAQSTVNFKSSGSNVGWSAITVEASVHAATYTENHIQVYYYEEPLYQQLSNSGTPANLQKPIMVKTDYKWETNSMESFKKHGNFSCRFTSADGTRVAYTQGKMMVYPPGQATGTAPSFLKCKSPKWHTPETVALDISVNGVDYAGGFSYTFSDILDLYRIVPMSGPNIGGTKVKLYGVGYTAAKDDVLVRFGVHAAPSMDKTLVTDYVYTETEFINSAMVSGSEILRAYKSEAFSVEKRDTEIAESTSLKAYPTKSPKLPNWNSTHGGPIYMSVGQAVLLNITNISAETGTTEYYNKTFYQYPTSYVEYYYYQQPVVKKALPSSGLTRGGTRLEISGAWFKYMPEYGIVPHCKIGDKVARAMFFSTVRIVCVTPPNEDINQLFPVQVSLNGVDFLDTGFTFHYYEMPLLYNMTPSTGPQSGGTEVFISGSKFSNISDPQNFNCRFTSTERDIPPKYIPAFYQNQTTIMCSSPGGWGYGDPVRVQVTFNGEDYSDNNFTFYFYNMDRAFPRSGPSDGTGGPIRVEGSGFRNESEVYCQLDKVLYDPLEISDKVIKCPMVKAKLGDTWFGTVDFSVVIDGNWHKFTGGFSYYPQVTLEDMYPHIGPSEGRGAIYFYGQNFRNDMVNVDIGCKIGESTGKGELVASGTIRCSVPEMELAEEGQTLPASVSLNSYSWAESNQTFVPYGVTGVFPNSGPYAGNTDVLITGKGFETESEKARCRFGVPADYAIVEAQVLSYDKLICRSPPEFKLPATADSTISVPIGVAFQEEEFSPWTESLHRFRFYAQPLIVRADPDEVEVGKLAEVYVFADDASEFYEPIPSSKATAGQYGIECKFGRFGVGMGVYLNKTTIKCVTPSVQEDPDSIWRDTVTISVAMNGQDFDEESSTADFTFVGTSSTLVFWPWVLGTLLIGLLLVALIVFCSALLQKASFERVSRSSVSAKHRPYVIRDPYDQFTSRAYSSGFMGRNGSSGPSGNPSSLSGARRGQQ